MVFARGRSHSNQITVSQSKDDLKENFRLDYSQGLIFLFSLSYFFMLNSPFLSL